jgi:hypothetical protein
LRRYSYSHQKRHLLFGCDANHRFNIFLIPRYYNANRFNLVNGCIGAVSASTITVEKYLTAEVSLEARCQVMVANALT